MMRALVWGLLEKVHFTMELMLLLLASLGWKVHRPRLSAVEVRFLAGLSTVLMYLGTLEVLCGEEPVCANYKLGRYVLQALCYLVIVFALHFNCQVVHMRLTDAFVSPTAADLYEKQKTYRVLTRAFFVVVMQPSVLLLIQVYILGWRQTWVYMLLRGLSGWLICMVVAFALCPRPPTMCVLGAVLGPEHTGESESDASVNGSDVATGDSISESSSLAVAASSAEYPSQNSDAP